MGASVVVLGASGFTGGEVLRLLAHHPVMTVAAASADSRAGVPVADVHPHLAAVFDLQLVPPDEVGPADVCFSCLPHGVLPGLLDEVRAEIVVDLADDFRAEAGWTYGLAELGDVPVGTTRIANPGCYPTATLLALAPLAAAGAIEGPVIVDALSGITGAGRSGADHLLLAVADNNASAYGTVAHRHVPEMERGLAAFGGRDLTVSFTPHLVPMARGLLVTARARWTGGDLQPLEVLAAAYEDASFVEVVEGWPATKAVAGTNNAQVSARLDPRAGFVVCSAAIDNLGKGAAGQAVQNANLALGLDERAGLDAVAVWP